MDKYEYRVCLDDIRTLISRHQYSQAAEIADTIDWTHVKSVKTLCMISDLYKINARQVEARDVLMMAYGKDPENSQIVYALCELELQLDEYVRALQFYTEFTRIAPKDPGRFILQYRLYEAQNVSLEERIAVLEELKKKSFRDKWVYELATLYNRTGLYSRCDELCNEIAAKGKPRYVRQALELKKTHGTLDAEQEAQYQSLASSATAPQPDVTSSIPPASTENISQMVDDSARLTGISGENTAEADQSDIHVKPMDENMVNTVNLQATVAEGLKDFIRREPDSDTAEAMREAKAEAVRREFRDGFDMPRKQDITEDAGTGREYDAARTEAKEIRKDRTDAAEQTAAAYDPYLAQETSGQLSMVIPEPARPSAPAPQPVSQDTGDASWDRTLQERQQRQIEETRKKMMQNTGPIFARFAEESKHGALEEIEHAFEEQQRSARFNEAVPEGGSLSDGMTNNERRQVEIAKSSDGSISKEDTDIPDSLIRDSISATRTWKGAAVEEQLNGQEQPDAAEEPEELEREAVKPEEEEPEAAEEEPAEPEREAVKPEKEAPVEQPQPKRPADRERDRFPETAPARKKEDLSETQQIAALVLENAAKEAQEESVSKAMAPAAEHTAVSAERESDVPATEELPDVKEALEDEDIRIAERPSAKKPTETAPEPAAEEENAAVPEEAQEPEAAEEEQPEEEPEEVEEEQPSEESEEEPQEEADSDGSEEPEEAGEEAEEPAAGEVPDSRAAKPQKGQPAVKLSPEDLKRRKEEAERIHAMTPEQRRAFGPFLHEKNTRAQLLRTLEDISLAACTGNVLITGDEGSGSLDLAKALLKDIRQTDRNFSGRVAIANGASINRKGIDAYAGRVENGGLVIEHCSSLSNESVEALHRILENEDRGLIVILTDIRKNMDRFIRHFSDLQKNFTSRIDIQALTDDELVKIAQHYAERQDCVIDTMAVLALHSRIADKQTIDHHVTVEEARAIVDDAIAWAEKKNLGHLMDSIFHKRYDSEDRIIIREKDFTH